MTDNNETGKANWAAKSLKDEEIIGLTDEVINASEEEIIELTDVVEQSPLTNEEKTISAFDDDSLETNLGLDEEFDEEQIIDNDFIGSLGIELEPETDISEKISDKEKQLESEDTQEKELVSETVSLSSEQIDEALGRVINKMYSEKIESMLAEMIEKAVTKEIERIKVTLIDDSADDEKKNSF